VVPRGDAEALARALATLLADAELRRRMGREGRRRALARFDWDQCAERLESLFRAATDGRAGHG
jgi:glycosyltransferase involved in cell wall biosynthesis